MIHLALYSCNVLKYPVDLCTGWGRNFRLLKGICSCVACNKTTASLLIIEILFGKSEYIYTKGAIKTLLPFEINTVWGLFFSNNKKKNNYMDLY